MRIICCTLLAVMLKISSIETGASSLPDKYFSFGLRLQNSLVSEKVELRRNHFGYGVFATAPISSSEIVVILIGKVMSREYHDSLDPDLQCYPLTISDDTFLGLDDKSRFDVAEYLNHSCDPNLGVLGNNIIVAMREIKPDEEVCFDYAMSETTSEDMGWKCECGTSLCRGVIRPDDWKRPELQKRYRHFFARYVLDKIQQQNEGELQG